MSERYDYDAWERSQKLKPIVCCEKCNQKLDSVVDIGCQFNQEGCYCVECALEIARKFLYQKNLISIEPHSIDFFDEE